jgi:hypothetical protein
LRKAWNWHNAEEFPALGPLIDIIVHATSNALKKALIKMSRCMGLRKCREQQNVAMMATTPKADREEAVRVTASNLVNCSSDRVAPPRGYSMIDCRVVTFVRSVELGAWPSFRSQRNPRLQERKKSKKQFYIA